MPYIKRNETGKIVSVHLEDGDGVTTLLPTDSPELVEFILALGDLMAVKEQFDRADREFVRVIEDVIYSLIEKRVLSLTDLPVAAQRKLADRRNLRGTKGDLGTLIDRSDNIF